jgi:hypothetical protein
VIHIDDFLCVGEYNQIEVCFKEKVPQQIKFTGGEVCTDHLCLSVSYSDKDSILNQRANIENYCKKHQMIKPAKIMNIEFNPLKMDNEVLEDRNKYLKATGYLGYLLFIFKSLCNVRLVNLIGALKSVFEVFSYLLETSNQGLFFEFRSTDDMRLMHLSSVYKKRI